MNKIMNLAVEIAHETSEWTRSNPMGKAGRKYTDVPSFATLQAEVTRLEAELAATVAENHKLSDLWSAMKEERDELRAKLAALEAQEPVTAQYQDRQGEWCNFINKMHRVYTTKDGTWPIRTLYLAAGAKP